METVRLKLYLTEAYRVQAQKAKEREDLRKCRLWVDLLDSGCEQAEVELNHNCIILRCGNNQESCTYDGVLVVTEMRNGILLRLSHKRLLWLPASEELQANRLLMDAMNLLRLHCRYHFRIGRLRLKGVDLLRKIAFHARGRALYTGDLHTNIIKGIVVVLVFLAGTGFIGEPYLNQKIQQHEGIAVCAELESTRRVYRKYYVTCLELRLNSGQLYEVDESCLGHGLQEKLEQLPKGTELQLLVHPKSDYVIQIQVGDEILLDFDYAQEQLWDEAVFFLFLGVFMYLGSVCLIVPMIRKEKWPSPRTV